MTQSKLLALVIEALEDVKAQNICVYDTSKKTSAFDNVVICSGTSNRQTRALANSVVKTVKSAGFPVHGLEGTDTGEWVLVDCGSIVIHCMQPTIRQYYNLEELWGPETLDLEMLKKAAIAAEEAKVAAEKAPKKKNAKKTASGASSDTEKKTPSRRRTAKKADDAQDKAPAKKRTTTRKATEKTTDSAPAKKRITARKAPAKKAE